MSPRPSATQRYREAFLYRDRVAELEGLIAQTSPALLTVDLGGWQVRRSRGGRGHASAVWPRDSREGRPLDDRIASVERFYAGAGIPPAFVIGPGAQPKGLERALTARGYRADPPVQVRTLSLEAFASRATGGLGAAARGAASRGAAAGADTAAGGAAGADAAARGAASRDAAAGADAAAARGAAGGVDGAAADGADGELTAAVAAEAAPAWLDGWAAAASVTTAEAATAGQLLAKVAVPSAYATVRLDGDPVAFARGIAYGGWLGVDHLAAVADGRRPDAGRLLAGALADWAAGHDAEEVFLQVDTGDPAAAALVGDLGGRVAFSYRFLRRDLAAVPRRPGR